MTRPKRPLNASEVFAGKMWFLGTTTDMRKAFPRIESVRVEVTARFNSMGQEIETKDVLLGPREFINCTNQRCYNGGFPLGQFLRSMDYERKTEEEWSEPCQGYEGSPKGRRKDGPCDNRFTVKLTVKHLPVSPDAK